MGHHAVALGQLLSFFVVGSDEDANTTFTYSADGLPAGATLDSTTGQFDWTPGPGQTGDYVVLFAVSDGEATVSKAALIRASISPQAPTVTIELTPSFAVVPGQSVLIHPIAGSLAEIIEITVVVNGQGLTLDEYGRAEYKPGEPGRFLVEAAATDADGRIGYATIILKSLDPADDASPVVSFGAGIDRLLLTTPTELIGTVYDTNLDNWILELEPLSQGTPDVIASSTETLINGILSIFDPSQRANGFYLLRLTATDISGRISEVEIIVEVNAPFKTMQYLRAETDLTIEIDGETISLIRVYDSLTHNQSDSFGFGWRLANRDFNIETDVALTGKEDLGLWNPYHLGARLYLTLPEGYRVGFTFVPQRHEVAGLTYYTPAWVADSGVDYTLESAQTLLVLVGNRLYDLKTGRPYNPTNGTFSDYEFTLTAPTGTVYRLSSARGVEEEIRSSGARFVYSDAGIVGPSGEMIQFVTDTSGNLLSVTTPDGTQIIYIYDNHENLVAIRNLATGQSSLYGYASGDSHLLTLAVSSEGSGFAIVYEPTPQIMPINDNLGTVSDFVGITHDDVLPAGQTNRYAFIIRDSEVASTNSDMVLLGIAVSGSGDFEPAVPVVSGLTPLSTWSDGIESFALYAIESAALEVVEISGADAVSFGSYEFEVFIAGDVNSDALVNQIDADLIEDALGSIEGDAGYILGADTNRDGRVDEDDAHILASNYNFTFNSAPIITSQTFLTHEDMEITIPLAELADDREGDEIYYRVTDSFNGIATLTPDGKYVRFVPDASFSGTAGFELIADDGYAVSAAEVITIEVSDSPLLHINFESRNPRLEVGQSTWLSVTGDFADQSDVLLPASYVTFESLTPSVGTISQHGQVIGLSSGATVLRASSHGIQAATAVAVGVPTEPTELLIYADGIDVVPQAVSIVPSGGQQQLFVTMSGDVDISNAIHDTLYFAGNPAVAIVSADGLIYAVAEGITEVTVINGAAEAVIPVKVTPTIAAPGIIGSEGGIVEDTNGTLVSIAPGGLLEDTEISLTLHDPTALTWAVPYPFELIAGFDLEIGDEPLWIPAELAIPVDAGVMAGTEVVFCELTILQDTAGNELTAWIEVDRGVVGNDGLAYTQTTLMPGVIDSGSYMVAYAPAGTTGQVKFDLSLMRPLSPLSGGFFVYVEASTEPQQTLTVEKMELSELLMGISSTLIPGSASSILYACGYTEHQND